MERPIELRSQEVQEILSRPPGALVRWGITALFAIIALLFVGGCFFRYPDVVEAEIVITTEHPPVWMVARTTGKLKEIFLPDRQHIKPGDVIGVMENPAVTADVLSLKAKLMEFAITDSCICTISFPGNLELGSIQSGYNTFMKALLAYRDFLQLDLYRQKEQSTRKELEEYRVYIGHLNNQTGFSEEEMKIAGKVFNREKLLYERGVISEADLETANQSYLAHKHAAEQLKIALSSSRIQETNLEQNIIEIQMEHGKEANTLQASLKSAYDELWVAINNWELAYLFVSPADGILSYQHVWKENQEVTTGDKVFSIVAEHSGDIIGKANLPASGIGKIKKGQRVNIRITGYPYMEFGYLTGEVMAFSLLANEEVYTLTVSLPQDLTTSYHQKLTFTGELSGTAEVITDERSFTARLFEPLRYLWEKRVGG